MRISDWSSDVCSSDLRNRCPASAIMLLCGFCSTGARERMMRKTRDYDAELRALSDKAKSIKAKKIQQLGELVTGTGADALDLDTLAGALLAAVESADAEEREAWRSRSEEHTSELQSLM